MNRKMQVGFSQRIQLEWLDYTVDLVLAGYSRAEIEKALQELLKDRLSRGRTAQSRGNREKAITILLKIWASPPTHVRELRDDGLELLRVIPREQHLPVHWGMTMAVYPFFAVVAEIVGRLLRLQDAVSQAEVQRRLREQFGERETVARAARRVMRCFIDWGVLQETSRKGVYQAAPAQKIESENLAAWLIEAALVASGSDARPLAQLVSSPVLFPFSLGGVTPYALETNGRLYVYREGLNKDVVMFRG
ncbi:MAG TPA: hypothetical protein DEA73_02445 [Peptococcaceae bacterium]|nr:hypothetical protein [Peptococcaceae bacterium]